MQRKETADFTVKFIECLKHGDDYAGVPFTLLPWQREAIEEFYGELRETEDGEWIRKYQYLYLEIPKKNGKSELAAALGLYHTFADGVKYGEVYCVAADKANASIIFSAAIAMINQSPYLKKRCKLRESTKEIVDTASGTKMKVLSSEAYSKHGYKPTCVIFDELHAQPNRQLWDVMTFGSGSARKQPVYIVLTTAGDDPDRHSIGWEIHEKAKKIAAYRRGETEGNYDNPIWLPIIYGIPDDTEEAKKVDIYDENLWYRCNPSLGHHLKIETLRQEAVDAKQSESAERLFRWLRLNQWIAIKSVGWCPITIFDKTEQEVASEALRGMRCYAGLDLSSTTDLTALVLLFPPQEGLKKWYALFKAWIPEEKMREREKSDHVDITSWLEKGYIDTTPGNCVDYDYVEQQIITCSQKYKLQLLGTDPYMSRAITQRIMTAGIEVVEVPQTMTQLSPPMKEIERLLRSDKMAHEKNLCARWCFGNVRCAVDGNENIKPMKNRTNGRIDIVVAWIIAMAVAMTKENTVDISAHFKESWSL